MLARCPRINVKIAGAAVGVREGLIVVWRRFGLEYPRTVYTNLNSLFCKVPEEAHR
jgi:hypothetical protein